MPVRLGLDASVVSGVSKPVELRWLGLSDRMLAVCLEAVNSDIRWNLRASQVEVYHPLDDRWLPSNDRLLEHLFQRIEERVRVDKGKGPVPPGWGGSRGGRRRSAFESLLHTKEVDPFVDWPGGVAGVGRGAEGGGLAPVGWVRGR